MAMRAQYLIDRDFTAVLTRKAECDMIYLSISENDKDIAKKYLVMAFTVSLVFFFTILAISQQRKVSNFFYILPAASFIFCYALSFYYKKRCQVNSVVVDDLKVAFTVRGNLKVYKLSDITSITVSKVMSSQEHYFDFYLHTLNESFLVPRLESVTDTQIVKIVSSLNKKIDIREIEKFLF